MRILEYLRADDACAVLIIDPRSLAIVEASRAACRFYGYSNEELTSLTLDRINTAPVERLQGDIRDSCAKGGRIFFYEHRLANGEVAGVRCTTGTFSCEGTTYFYSVVQEEPSRQTGAAREEAGHALSERELLLHELDHRVRNNLQLIESMAFLYLRRGEGPEREVERFQNKVQAIATAYELSAKSDAADRVLADTFLKAIAVNASACRREGGLSLTMDCEPGLALGLHQAVALGIIADSALSDALERGEQEARLRISVDALRSGGRIELRVSDDAKKPPSPGGSVEEAVARAAAAQLGAQLETRILPLGGAEFRCSFPASSADLASRRGVESAPLSALRAPR